METNNLVHYSGVFNNNELDKIVNKIEVYKNGNEKSKLFGK